MNASRLLGLKNKKILVVTHKGADIDAIASAAIVRKALMKKNFVEIAVPESINHASKKFAEAMDIAYNMQPDFAEFDILVIVDLNSYAMLGAFAEKVKNFHGDKFLFDHHTKVKDAIVPDDCSMIIEDATATTEVLWLFLKKNAPEKIEKTVAMLVACGIISDTDRFSFASKNTFRIMADVIPKTKKDFQSLLEIISSEHTISERIAVLKAMKQIKILGIGKSLIVLSKASAFESQTAEALLSLGADLALVGTIKGGKARIAGRASFSFASRYKIDLARDIFQKLQVSFGGDGGGHVTAAAFVGEVADLEKALDKCVELIHQKILKKEPHSLVKEYK